MDTSHEKRVATEGLGFGLLAGAIYLAAEMAFSGVAPPLRAAASVVLGFHALDSSLGRTFLAGLVVHFVFSGVLGLIYGECEARLPPEPRRHHGLQIATAMLFAGLVWLVAFELVGNTLYPWLVSMRPVRQLALEALFYGAPLGWMFAAAERRVPLVIRPSVG
ncbi:MAG TPA: hypothetical protein VGH28_09610 [Polyangiaceae bacterium]|jgi:hypothetical protein